MTSLNGCIHDDCFTCPYKDCISAKGPQKAKLPTQRKINELGKEDKKVRHRQACKKYYDTHPDKVRESKRAYYQKRKKKKDAGGKNEGDK